VLWHPFLVQAINFRRQLFDLLASHRLAEGSPAGRLGDSLGRSAGGDPLAGWAGQWTGCPVGLLGAALPKGFTPCPGLLLAAAGWWLMGCLLAGGWLAPGALGELVRIHIVIPGLTILVARAIY
jgi:hypothetical protein